MELELGCARRGPRWDARAGRSLQILGFWRSLWRAGPAPEGGGDPQPLLQAGRELSGMDSGGCQCAVHRDNSGTVSPGTA